MSEMTMDQLIQCPVCTLYLHNGMSLESHLDTHPKDRVIKALCSLSASRSNYGSRCTTPSHSERSFRSRSRTPAMEESNVRWNNIQLSERDRYTHRTSKLVNGHSNHNQPDFEILEQNLGNSSSDNVPIGNASSSSKINDYHSIYPNGNSFDYDRHYVYIQDQPTDEPESKYSRNSGYSTNACNYNTGISTFTYNMQAQAPNVRIQSGFASQRHNDFLNVIPKNSSNIAVVKTNVGSVQYVAPVVKPVHVMLPPTSAFINAQHSPNNILMTSSVTSTSQAIPVKTVSTSTLPSQYNQMTRNGFTPGTTVVTQNSQIIYREMVHNINGKPFISTVPTVLSAHENLTNVAQTNSLYQNVMVMEPYRQSCLYLSQPPISVQNDTRYNATVTENISSSNKVKDCKTNDSRNETKKSGKDLGTLAGQLSTENYAIDCNNIEVASSTEKELMENDEIDSKILNGSSSECPQTKKGLKILSNIKVEVPVTFQKQNMFENLKQSNTQDETDITQPSLNESEKILPDLYEHHTQYNAEFADQPSTSIGDCNIVKNTFSVIKNIGNPPGYRGDTSLIKNKIDKRFENIGKLDITPVSDLPSNEVMVDCTNQPNPAISQNLPNKSADESIHVKKPEFTYMKSYKNSLQLNNIYIKKHKKILQIKNAKTLSSTKNIESNSLIGSSSNFSSTSSEISSFTSTKLEVALDKKDKVKSDTSQSVEKKSTPNDFDTDTEVQSMDIEPVTLSMVNYKEQFSNYGEIHIKHETTAAEHGATKVLTHLESIRPLNVISYGNVPSEDFDGDSSHKELLELEASSRTKHYVSMMNDNYFGDNIYADYFTPDRVESFEPMRDTSLFYKENQKTEENESKYMWGESSHRESFRLPNFIQESYRIAENASCGSYTINAEGVLEDVELCGNNREREPCCETENDEQDSKLDILSESRSDSEVALNICADERMPPRGELSGQESNGDMDTPWTGIYQEVADSRSYDLMARETWLSDGSEVDSSEKIGNLDKHFEVSLKHETNMERRCTLCNVICASPRDLSLHLVTVHENMTSSCCSSENISNNYQSVVVAQQEVSIKKEGKCEDSSLSGGIITNKKLSITSSILQIYNEPPESKPDIKTTVIKQETKRRRRDFVCPTCKEDQRTEIAFHAHLRIHPLECLTCGKCFYKRANLQLHNKIHLGTKNFKCDVCEKRFFTKQKVQEHLNVHTGRAPIKCTICNESFRRYSNMIQHRDRHHFQKKKKVRDFLCDCGDVFHSLRKLVWHKEIHEDRPKSCPYCINKFVHTASLTRHVRRAHNAYYVPDKRRQTENILCPICKQVYLKSNLEAHLKTHTGKKPYQCVVCNKCFTTKWNLKLHRWTHASRSSKPFKCNICKGAFIRQAEYQAHMNAHKAIRPFTCNYCGCQFIRKYNCQRHVREHETEKKYICKVPECGKTFHRSYYLTEHMRVHSGARPFSCGVCGKTSSNKSNHNKHVRIHHAREPVTPEA